MSGHDTPEAISARIDRLPPSGPLWSWVARVSFGGFFEIYETALTSLLAPALAYVGIFNNGRGGLFGLPDLATLAFATFAGLFAGALLFSFATDRFGRRSIFTYSLIWYAIATLIMGLQSNSLAICLWRFVASIGVGAEIVAVDAYLSELVPKTMRGRGFAISKSIQYAAVPLAGLLTTALARKTFGGFQGWRIVLLVPAIGAILIWWVRRGLPESPRWLAEHGRREEAHAILERIEEAIAQRTGRPLPQPLPIPAQPALPQGAYLDLFGKVLLRRTLMMMVASSAGTIAYFGFGNWLPTLLEARGVLVTKSLLYSSLIALSFPLSPLLFSVIADRIERKWQIVAGAAVTAVAGLLFARETAVAGWIFFGLLISIGSNLFSYAMHTYRSELFPTGLRARAIGLVYSIDRLTAAGNSYLTGLILVNFGATGVLLFVTAASLVNMVVVAAFGPRTRGLATEEITDSRRSPGRARLQHEV
jgi:MFS transporter, putative metabolite:H+ symporter